MKGWEQWRDVYSSEGQLLFAGLRAKVSVFHGQMTRIVPHTTTGRLPSLPQLAQPTCKQCVSAPAKQLYTRSIYMQIDSSAPPTALKAVPGSRCVSRVFSEQVKRSKG